MKKNEIIKEILGRMRNKDGTYKMFPLKEGIIPDNDRIGFVKGRLANFITARCNDGKESLILVAKWDEGHSTASWPCPAYGEERYRKILDSLTDKVYVITIENAECGCTFPTTVGFVTADRDKAREEFIRYKNDILSWKEDMEDREECEFPTEETEDTFFCYKKGDSDGFHFSVTVHEKVMDKTEETE